MRKWLDLFETKEDIGVLVAAASVLSWFIIPMFL